MSNGFTDLGLAPDLLATLETLGYTEPTPIQSQAIPHLLTGKDVMGQAQTGTGKTAAFTLPIIQQLEGNGLQVLILTPTRELAIQVSEAVHRYGQSRGVRVLPVYGGQSYDRQLRRLKKGVNVVVGTPGRTLDLINKKALHLGDVRYVILDEADEMLNMGFIEDVETILSATNAQKRQTILFSATFNKDVLRLAKKYMHDPLHITIESEDITVANVTQRYFMVEERDKVAALSRLLEVEEFINTLIFCRTKVGAAELAETLIERGYPAFAIHGDLPQNERERILGRFRSGHLTILVATDVVARGVDIPEVSHVVNFDIPQLAIEYVHRIGRTGRAGRSGHAITLISPKQRRALQQIERYIEKRIEKGKLPSRETVLERRQLEFVTELINTMNHDTEADYSLLAELAEMGYAPEQIALAAIKMLRTEEIQRPLEEIRSIKEGPERELDRKGSSENGNEGPRRRRKRDQNGFEPGMVRLHMDVGKSTGIRPADVVFSIASGANIPGRVLGAIDIRQNETFVDVPEAHVDTVLNSMKRSRIKGQQMNLVKAR